MNNNVIVFDIGGVLCWHPQYASQYDLSSDIVPTLHPECPKIEFRDKYLCHNHIFIPYLDILMKYLIDNGSRIVFFSAGTKLRNKVVVKKLLIELFGEQDYADLVLQGQFEVFSVDSMRAAVGEEQEQVERNFGLIKDLSVVISESETLENTILIEDQPAFAAYDQKPCLVALPLQDIFSFELNNNFVKNAAYYLLGIVSSYFNQYENQGEDFERPLPDFKIWLENFLLMHSNPSHYDLNCYKPFKYDKLVEEMINIGLAEVQQTYPDAIFYGIDSLKSEHAVKLIESPLKPKPQWCI